MDKVNKIHSDNCHTPGIPFVQGLLNDLDITIKIKNEHVLQNLPEGSFITVSNHPFGALDGIMLIKVVGEHRPDFKVMVNMFLNHISAMRPNFIDVDPLASDDPAKRAVSMKGIAEAWRHVKEGAPIGFFPAGAVSKFKWTWGLRIQDRPWQPNIMRLIQKMNVPIIPIYFHGHNSVWFTLLGMIDWRLRTLRLPAEVFRRKGDTFRVSIGDPIMPDVYGAYDTPESLGVFLKDKTYSMKKW
jgi:putative hemolysin